MENFVTLLCPTCGGKLQVKANQSILICNHCGNSHLIKREGSTVFLESFACCPLCGRNDKSEKVSAIVRRERQTINSIQQITNNSSDQYAVRSHKISTRQTSISDLAKYLMPPHKPPKLQRPSEKFLSYNKWGPWAIIFFIFGLMIVIYSFFAVLTLVMPTHNKILLCFGIFLLFSSISGLLIYKSRKYAKEIKIQNEKINLKHKSAIEKWQAQINMWEKSIQRWEKLYYCQRDDCIFVPDEGTWAPIAEMNKYLSEDS